MNIHEYQAKALFTRYDIPVLTARLIKRGDDVKAVCESLQGRAWVAKAQIHAGGRGKAGGVTLIDNPNELDAKISSMLGKKLVTGQTGEDGLPVNAVLLEEIAEIKCEIYVALLVDRDRKKIAVIASSQRGVDME